ncbi:MAG: hypothetical protein JXQ73_24520 [Phycisphaerae bacterium]|nr:hypothetical protein [Phycisphaerae bacterium]
MSHEPVPSADPTPQGDLTRESSLLDDEALFCPVCEYNLTGNVAGRCSECGSLFDRERLIEARRLAAEALMPWERKGELSVWRRFVRTLSISCVRPHRFTLALSVQPQRSRASSFMLACLTLFGLYGAATAGMLWWSSPRFKSELPPFLVLIGELALGIVAATIAVAGAFAAAYPIAGGQRRLGPWLGIVCYAGAHWLLVWTAFPAMVVVQWYTKGLAFRFVDDFTTIFFFACFLLWAFTLSAVARSRVRTAFGKAMTLVLAIVVGGLTWAGTVWLLSLFVRLLLPSLAR